MPTDDPANPDKSRYLRLPKVDRVRFPRNFIRTAVCELRFPTLLELEAKPPIELSKRLRKDYPIHSEEHDMKLSPGAVRQEAKHLFRSRKMDWVVSFKSSSIALETIRYKDFEDFCGRLDGLIKLASPLLDTDFFTRVGLRYLNEITVEDRVLEGWLRPELTEPLARGVYGQVDHCIQMIQGFTEVGKYTFRHGLSGEQFDGKMTYNLDFDFYQENVSVVDAIELVRKFNLINFSLFMWTIGDKARAWLGEPEKKAQR